MREGIVTAGATGRSRAAVSITGRRWVVLWLGRRRWRRRRDWLVADVDLVGGQKPAHAIDKLERVEARPKVNVDGMQRVVVDVLVGGVVGGKVPLVLVGRLGNDGERDHAAVLVGVGDGSGIKKAVKGVLALGAGIVGNLDARAALLRILKEIDVRALVEAVVRRVVGLRAVEVMDVSEALCVCLSELKDK